MTKSALGALMMLLALSAVTATSALASGPPIVETNAATLVEGTEATLNATVTANGATTKYAFEYGPTTSYGTKTAEQTVLVSKVAKRIVNLSTKSTYHFRVVATNSFGTSYGGDQAFTTPSEKPEFAVKSTFTGLTYQGGTNESAVWDADGGAGFSCNNTIIKGLITGAKSVQGKLIFRGCRVGSDRCKSVGGEEEEIVTQELQGTLVYLSKTAKTVALVFRPLSGTSLANFKCITQSIDEVHGAIIVPLGPVASGFHFGFWQERLTLLNNGEQAVTQYENGRGEKVHASLETNWPQATGTFYPLGWQIASFYDETNKEIEIQA